MLNDFSPATRQWFTEAFTEATPVQEAGWAAIAAGEHALLLAPTGSGKTLAAFLWGIDRLLRLPKDSPPGVRVLYVSPLKALVYDIERNLRAPLVGATQAAARLGTPWHMPRIGIRTGDTSPAERNRMRQHPPDILVTTPESLYLMLSSQVAQILHSVHTLIVDEIHALAPTKRGVHLSLSLERLSELTRQHRDGAEPQRIGLSATVRPHHEVARFLGGNRPVAVIDKAALPNLDLQIVVPVPDMDKPAEAPVDSPVGAPLEATDRPERGGPILGELWRAEVVDGRDKKVPHAGMWAAIYPALLQRIEAHTSTILFVNSRSLCERLSQRLNEMADKPLVRAHHGSLSLRQRVEIEEQLKNGQLKALVATSSLELGIDMGAVDLVILVESPGSVARGLQRIGRAGHGVGQTSRGLIFPKFRGDLLECAVVADRMRQGELEPLAVPQNCLDVLSQQLVAMCIPGPQSVDALAATVGRSYPYHGLSRQMLISVLEMLSGTYPSDEFAELRPLLSWDRSTDVLEIRRGGRLAALMSAGTIVDRGMYAVYLAGQGPRIGELDEEMVHESRPGDVFLLGASSWRIQSIDRDRVQVTPAPGEPGKMPFWRGDGPGRPIELGRAIGAWLRQLEPLSLPQTIKLLKKRGHLDALAAQNLATYIGQQRDQTGGLPTDRRITIERFVDEIGDWRVCILTPFGARVHAPWALALEASLSKQQGYAVQTMSSDDGIVLRFADHPDLHPSDAATAEATPMPQLLLDPASVETLVMEQLAQSALFASHFRENASRALLLPGRRFNSRTPLWQQRLRSKNLLAAAQRYASFPMVLETYRQCLRDVFDMPALRELLLCIERRQIQVDWVITRTPSPFARSLAFAYVAAYLYEGDTPLAERRAQALTLDRELLQELLGETQLRELLDPLVLEEVEAQLQGLAEGYAARDADEVHDLLRRLGDLSGDEVEARYAAEPRGPPTAAACLQQLKKARRAVDVRLLGKPRWIAAEDAGRYRDALGVVPPGGLPARFIESAPPQQALASLIRRYARSRGPFTLAAFTARYGVQPAELEPQLRDLERQGLLVHGELLPHGVGTEWCDSEVLRRLKRLTLARLRQEVAAVDATALGRFLPRWQQVDPPRRGLRALESAILQLEGLSLPFSCLCHDILPARVADFHLDMLDMLCASGAVVWMGCAPLGSHDGRIRLVRRSQAPLLCEVPAYTPPTEAHAAVLSLLAKRGACFTVEVQAVSGCKTLKGLQELLWDLVWAGQITNDTVGPLRGLEKPSRRAARQPVRPSFGGRWSRVVDLIQPGDTPASSPTAKAHAQAQMLLERYGVLSREAVAAEDLTGGFSQIYPVLKAMEQAGKLRRGHFVEGLQGAQFAYAGAVEQLRAQRKGDAAPGAGSPTLQVLSCLDPANPYGSLLAWPTQTTKPKALKRLRGSLVALWDGAPLLYVEANGTSLLTFPLLWDPDRDPGEAARLCSRALRQVASRRPQRSLLIEHIDGIPALRHPQQALLEAAGMLASFNGMMISAQGKEPDLGPSHA